MPETGVPRHGPTYASIMVPLHLGVDAQDSVRLAAALARAFSSRLIGVAAEEFVLPYYGDGAIAIDPVVVDDARRKAVENLAKAEAVFRREAATVHDLEWRAAVAPPQQFVLDAARAADLVVVGRQGPDDAGHGAMAVSPGDLAMGLGRPLLLVPPRKEALSGKRIVIAWKNSREARRAVLDALPLLKRAELVSILAIGTEAAEQGAEDVVEYLRRHGIASRATIRSDSTRFVIDEILAHVEREGADLIVSGAYGHSRMREWLFGGVTQDLLNGAPVPCLMSH